jgi:RHH-type transcriptional regulator, proline utilization regulon repressor / proline dehydrogenase / delta 1-pyrroline-5-carboxylate dehydrogenase
MSKSRYTPILTTTPNRNGFEAASEQERVIHAEMPGRLQAEIEKRGLRIFHEMERAKSGSLEGLNVTGRLMEWSMRNEDLKVQLFRFVDVLPSLSSSRDIAQHAFDYLGDERADVPKILRWGVKLAPKVPWLAALAARSGVKQMARTFILASDGKRAVPALRKLRRKPSAFTMDILGETAVSEREADEYQARYLELIKSLAEESEHWPVVEQIDIGDRGPLPKVNVSVKISALYSQIRATDPEGAMDHISRRLKPLLLAARERGVFINFDMESMALKEMTLDLFKRLLEVPELREYEHVGIALQAYLKGSERDMEDLIAWARAQQQRITIRLIKGAYWDYETVLSQQRGWPIPVFEQKPETDANYERLARTMLKNRDVINCAFGTHNVRSIAACMVMADKLGVARNGYEFQMLHGMAEPIKNALIRMGYRVREYCPIGEVLPGMSYLVRRLLENTSNEGFLRATFNERLSPRELLRDPAELVDEENVKSRNKSEQFQNEPLTDFTMSENREQMRRAIEKVRGELGKRYPLIIGGKEVWTVKEVISINPAKPSQLVGEVARGGRAEADAALQSATDAFREWSRKSVEERAAIIERAGELMRAEKFELAALEIFETGKNWSESDADVAEAIDFCNYYAEEMRRIAVHRYPVPGEMNLHHYVARGVGVVIAPWNFPLAILCGMTTAALVTGNCVIIKPSEQSSVIGAKFMDILRRAGVPDGVANFLPGSGEEVGAYLVNHPSIHFIAFTGSREVGLKIWESAGRTHPGQKHLKSVICEMGGKNAMIIDSDADLDEAIPSVLYSAFGYQGQKCSALSRLIILEQNHERVLERLSEAAKGLQMGFPEEPGTALGPVIDSDAYKRILEYIELGKREGKLVFQGVRPEGEGYFIPPTIFANVAAEARIAREEIFGPVLSVLKAENLDQALAWANDSEYALTGGFFSRSPGNIERVKREMEVGNLYINRGITGAIVARHPFGGFKMSGGGTKAGGRDYLLHFMLPRVWTENTMRRGFAPEEFLENGEGKELQG